MIEHIQEPQNSDDALECLLDTARSDSMLINDLCNVLNCPKEKIMIEVLRLVEDSAELFNVRCRLIEAEFCGA